MAPGSTGSRVKLLFRALGFEGFRALTLELGFDGSNDRHWWRFDDRSEASRRCER